MDISDVEMKDKEKRVQDLAVDGQDSEINLVDAKVERQKEESPGSAAADDQNDSETGAQDQKPSENEAEYQKPNENGAEHQNLSENRQLPLELPASEAHQRGNKGMKNVQDEPDHETAATTSTATADGDAGLSKMPENKNDGDDIHVAIQHEPATPNSLVKCSNAKAEDDSGETSRNGMNETMMADEDGSGTPEDKAAFMKELESFYRESTMEFKPPKFYGQPLNCLKLWRAVTRLGGYDRVTASKLWRQVGESFHPPKTCTTVSWTFRIFYEKALLEYERHKRQNGELQLPVAALPEPSSVENEANGYQPPGSGRARRDAAARAMQGWHVQRLFGYGEVGEPIIKDKNFNHMSKRERNLKSIGSLKHKRPTEVEHAVKAARTELAKQLVTTVVDVGPPADWVKINVRETKDCFEVYALVPGLLREEVRVQSDPAGRLVITGQPEQPDNPWGITAFKKVVSLPARIDPLQTSAVVSLHGRLFVRVPFEQSNI
uniref:Putative AT-rich interactive domain-containing protein 5 n=1 Tax=Davidia involucrata TaxID=16924 RepID=A0A5B7A9G7_DAVIN